MNREFCDHCGNRLTSGTSADFKYCKLCFQTNQSLNALFDRFSYPNDSLFPSKTGSMVIEWIEKLSIRNHERIRELEHRVKELEGNKLDKACKVCHKVHQPLCKFSR
jgi:hypothetical protein